MSNAWKLLLVTIFAMTLMPKGVFADDEEKKDEAAAEAPADESRKIEGAEEATNDSSGDQTTASNDEAKEDASSKAGTDADTGAREEAVLNRLKKLVKDIDSGAAKKGNNFPAVNVERALRSEMLRRVDGNNGIAWAKKRLNANDTAVGMDNLELLIAYSERLLEAAKKKANAKGKDLAELKVMASKAVIDMYNFYGRRGMMRGETPLAKTPKKLSAFGKAELKRRQMLVAMQVAGEDYAGIPGKSFDDFTHRYRQALENSVKEYDKLAGLLGGGRAVASVDKGDDAPAAKGEKKGKDSKKAGKDKKAAKGKDKKAKKKKSAE